MTMNRFGILTLFLGGLLFVSACEDYPQMVDYPVPQPTSAIGKALVEGTDQISVIYKDSTYTLHKGVEVTEMAYLSSEGRSIRTFWYKIDLSEPTINLECVTPYGTHTVGGNPEVLSKMLSHVDKEGNCVLGGINTDFFITDTGPTAGQAQGIFWHKGICIKDTFNSQTNRPRCFVYWDGDETVRIASSSYYTQIKASTSLREAFSGGQFLVVNGGYSTITADSVYGVHPRTMFGVQEGGKKVILVVLDGRNSVLAVGMNYPDMQKIMKALGSFDSINIDGGGSSTFIVRDTSSGGYGLNAKFLIKNMPSDGTERAIGPGLAIVASD